MYKPTRGERQNGRLTKKEGIKLVEEEARYGQLQTGRWPDFVLWPRPCPFTKWPSCQSLSSRHLVARLPLKDHNGTGRREIRTANSGWIQCFISLAMEAEAQPDSIRLVKLRLLGLKTDCSDRIGW